MIGKNFCAHTSTVNAPETFLIDDDGVIHYKHIGALTVDVWAQKFLPIINELKQ